MSEAFVDDNCRDFWQEVSQYRTSKQTSAPYVDGFTLMQVLQTYGFPHLRTSPYPQAHSQLDDTLFKPKITKGELEAAKVMPDIIQRAIKKLKRGKSDGEALTSDHLISVPVSLSKILPPIVTSLPRHEHMPSCVSDAAHPKKR